MSILASFTTAAALCTVAASDLATTSLLLIVGVATCTVGLSAYVAPRTPVVKCQMMVYLFMCSAFVGLFVCTLMPLTGFDPWKGSEIRGNMAGVFNALAALGIIVLSYLQLRSGGGDDAVDVRDNGR